MGKELQLLSLPQNTMICSDSTCFSEDGFTAVSCSVSSDLQAYEDVGGGMFTVLCGM